MINVCIDEWFKTKFIQDLHAMRLHVLIERNLCTWKFPARIMFHNEKYEIFLNFVNL